MGRHRRRLGRIPQQHSSRWTFGTARLLGPHNDVAEVLDQQVRTA
ncbi:hypothetical protein F750_7067 (plasmid) [Streptomyces sp. PAMC 26508]|nr:hypothetical protein F750_7067 [Streptomyces sp. PAMC 26508]